jgi:hypothetical protein
LLENSNFESKNSHLKFKNGLFIKVLVAILKGSKGARVLAGGHRRPTTDDDPASHHQQSKQRAAHKRKEQSTTYENDKLLANN